MLGLVKGFNKKLINPGKEGWWPDYRKVMFPLNFERVHERAHLRTREPLPPSCEEQVIGLYVYQPYL